MDWKTWAEIGDPYAAFNYWLKAQTGKKSTEFTIEELDRRIAIYDEDRETLANLTGEREV